MSELTIEELCRRIERLGDSATYKPALEAAADHLVGILQIYPPTTIANMPGRQYAYNDGGVVRYREAWYERNYGPRWRPKRGKHAGQVMGYQTSEMLGKSWTWKLNSNTEAEVGNDASYASLVQGPKQTPFHAKRGWKTVKQVFTEERQKIMQPFHTIARNVFLGR